MKKSLLGLMAAVMVSALAVATDYAHTALRYAYSVAGRMSRSLMTGLAEFKPEPLMEMPKVAFVKAKSFVQRIVKRERPILSNTWRMCPSI